VLTSKAHLLFLGLIPLSFASQADEMQFFQAANHYANSCIQHHGTPYLTPDHGANWHQIDPQEIAKVAEHQKSVAVMNGLMTKDKITRQQITEYIDKNAAAWANTYEKTGYLKCQVGGKTLALGNIEDLSVKQPISGSSSTPSQPEWQKVFSHTDLEYYTDLSSEDPVGFGKFMTDGKVTVIRINATCSDSDENYQVTLLDTQRKGINTTTHNPSDNEKITAIKNAICSDAYGRNYQ